jgi:hypothetical protein
MPLKEYYSQRIGKRPSFLNLNNLKNLFINFYQELEEDGCFQEKFGTCSEWSRPYTDRRSFLFLKSLRRDTLWPIYEHINSYTEEDLFDVIEFLYDLVSKPEGEKNYCDSCETFHYYDEFYDKNAGRLTFREKINELLELYDGGFQLTFEGQIVKTEDLNLEIILKKQISLADRTSQEKLEHAIKQMQKRHLTHSERKEAVRLLGDILEPIRPEIKKYCRKDEKELFDILNNFGHRHHRPNQKTEYDSKIFDTWLFYHYLAAVHAYVRIFDREKSGKL